MSTDSRKSIFIRYLTAASPGNHTFGEGGRHGALLARHPPLSPLGPKNGDRHSAAPAVTAAMGFAGGNADRSLGDRDNLSPFFSYALARRSGLPVPILLRSSRDAAVSL